jgi:gas vesicle protein
VGRALTFLFIGLGVGALAGLLFAPKTGKQMRRLLRRKYEDTVESLIERADELKERGSDLVERGSDLVERSSRFANAAKEKVAPFAKAAKSRMR